MRVALDLTPTITGTTGVARYAHEIYRGLLDLGVDVAPFALGRGRQPPPSGTRHWPVPLRMIQRSWQLSGHPRVERIVGPVDIAHCLDLVPAPSRCPRVMTAHDLLAITRPELHSVRQRDQQTAQLKALCKADLVLANSRTTLRSLVEHGVAERRIVVTPLGVTPLQSVEVVPFPGKYVLAVGELTARKNLPLLIRAFTAANLPDDIELLLVGPEGYAAEEVLSQVGGRVRALGRVDEGTLASLYAGAIVFCFPSLAEGFGLPVLEALQAGAPVLASDLDVLREVAGNVAAFVPAEDESAWTRALEELVDLDQGRRREVVERGQALAAGLTWEATARATLEAYQRL